MTATGPAGSADDPARHAEQDDFDSRFADIVSHWDDPSAPPVAAPSVDAPTAWRVHVPPPAPDDLFEDEDAHFEPEPPAPLPAARDDWRFWAVLGCLVLGPLVILGTVMLRPVDSGWLLVAGIAATVAGFVMLVARQPYRGHSDDDPDLGIRL